MSSPRQNITVSREYEPMPDACVQALELLLNKSASKKAAGRAASKDAKVRSKNDSRANSSIP